MPIVAKYWKPMPIDAKYREPMPIVPKSRTPMPIVANIGNQCQWLLITERTLEA